MFGWIRRLLFGVEVAWHPEWDGWLREDYAHWHLTDDPDAERAGLDAERWRELIARFVALSKWEASRDFELTERMRVVIAAQATRLLLGLPIDDYPSLGSVLVRRTVARTTEARRTRAGTMTNSPRHLAGQAGHDGSIVVVWSSVRREARAPLARTNVVYHEFAHRLDMSDGTTDGTPPLGDADWSVRWREAMQPAFERVERGESILRPYAATNPAEFFAVATEHFLCRAGELARFEPAVYDELHTFYAQHPALVDPIEY